jgi:predicted transcriptional regulator
MNNVRYTKIFYPFWMRVMPYLPNKSISNIQRDMVDCKEFASWDYLQRTIKELSKRQFIIVKKIGRHSVIELTPRGQIVKDNVLKIRKATD